MTVSDITEWFNAMIVSLTDMVSSFLPKLLLALLVFVIGWVLAIITKNIIIRTGQAIARLLPENFFWHSSNTRSSMRIAHVIAFFSYWLILIGFTISAIGNLGINSLNSWLSTVLSYLPNLISAAVILFIGYIFGQVMVKNLAPLLRNMEKEQSDNLLRFFYLIIIVISAILAVNQIGIDTSLLTNLITLTFAAFAAGLALSIGLGAGPFFANMLSARQVAHTIKVGDHIIIDDIPGQVLSIEATEVLIAAESGRVRIPARRFNETAVTITGESNEH